MKLRLFAVLIAFTLPMLLIGAIEGQVVSLDVARGPSEGPISESDFASQSSEAGEWIVMPVDEEGRTGSSSSLALDTGANAHVSYIEYGNGDLRYGFQEAGNWYTQTLDTNDITTYGTSLALDANGFPHISYQSGYDLKYVYRDDAGWHFQTVDTVGEPANQNQIRSSLALDSTGRPHISYYDPVNDDLKYSRYNGAEWDSEVVEADGNAGFYNSIAVDSQNQPHVSFYSLTDTQRIRYGVRNEGGWQIETVDSGGAGPHNSIALDGNDRPHIAYYAYLRDTNLYYAYLGDTKWEIEVADDTGDVGKYPSIAVDGTGVPHISYYGAGDNTVRYTYRDSNGVWHPDSVASGAADEWIALTLDEQIVPHITFLNYLGEDLMYAYRNSGVGLPPAAIDDLMAVSGANPGQVDLAWTAPQGITTTMSYQVRYAASPIESELGWTSATAVSGAPNPELAGTTQSMTVSSLTPGQTYYFAIRAEDEASNISELSNSPSAMAKEGADLGFRPNPNGYQFANKQLWRTWEMFEQYFGSENVLKPDGNRCAAANAFFQNQYRTVANGWSCLGFSQTGLLSYLDWPQPNAGSFATIHFEQLYQEPESTQLTNPIAFYSGVQTAKQWGDMYSAWKNTCNTNSDEMIETIRQGIENQQPVVVSLNTGISIWHTLVPYRVEDIAPTIVDVYVYDSEATGQERTIRFQDSGGGWQWEYTFVGSLGSAGARTGGCNDMYPYALQTALEQGLPRVNFCQSSNSMTMDSSQTTVFSGKMLAHLPAEGDWVIQDGLGHRLGWVNGELISEIPDAYNIPQVLGDASLSFRALELPEAEYSVTINDAITETIAYSLFGDGRLIEVSGSLQSIGSSATLSVTSNLDQATLSSLQNLDSFVMGFDNEMATESQLATITGVPTSGNEDLNASFDSGQLVISRTNGIIQYSLAFEKNDGQLFVSELLTLGANNTHTLRPTDWVTLDSTDVILEIDYDSDGTVDDIQVLTNQLNREFVYLPIIIRP